MYLPTMCMSMITDTGGLLWDSTTTLKSCIILTSNPFPLDPFSRMHTRWFGMGYLVSLLWDSSNFIHTGSLHFTEYKMQRKVCFPVKKNQQDSGLGWKHILHVAFVSDKHSFTPLNVDILFQVYCIWCQTRILNVSGISFPKILKQSLNMF